MPFRTILVAVDGSKHASKIAELAADLAHSCGAKLLILHVVAPIFEGKIRNELGDLARIEHMERTEYEMLQQVGADTIKFVEVTARKKGVKDVEVLIEVGDPAGVIVSIARARSADIIVLGRRGVGTLAGLLFGSVSYKVTQVADRPCLIVS